MKRHKTGNTGQTGSTDKVNLLFQQWLEEWRDEAKEKGLNSQHTYGKALASLKKYPLPLRSGSEAKILENVDIPVPEPPKKTKPSSSKSPTGNHTSPSSQKKRRQSAPYVPTFRSGGYALLVTLFNETQGSGSHALHLTKVQLQNLAQPLCDASLMVTDPGSHYSAWSSMGTLIKKGFVMKYSSPAKYMITESGIELAKQLLSGSGNISLLTSPACPALKKTPPANRPRPNDPPPKLPSLDINVDLPSPISTLAESTPSCSTSISPYSMPAIDLDEEDYPLPSSRGFLYWFVDYDGKNAAKKDDASVTVSDAFGLGFLVKCDKVNLEQAKVLYEIDTERAQEGRSVYAYVADKDVAEVATLAKPRQDTKTKTPSSSAVSSSFTRITEKTHVLNSDNQSHSRGSQCLPASSNNPTLNGAPVTNPDFKSLTLHPGEFEIVLCVDISETTGSSKRKEILVKQLQQTNIRMDIRKLQVGDFLWVAKQLRPKPGEDACEMVLDFVIERKRMDDLASSIVDGRFKEQKYRLKRCGLRRPIYLVEDHGSMQHTPIPEATLRQAIVNTHVVDGFIVKRTSDIYESAAYLALMTRQLTHMYKNKTVTSVPLNRLGDRVDFDVNSLIVELMTFTAFDSSTAKNQVVGRIRPPSLE